MNNSNTLHSNAHRWAKRLLMALLTWGLLVVGANAQNAREAYTESKPLIVVCDWDFPPYEFINSDGVPSGYHVEVIDAILEKMGIPHKFVMNARSQAIEAYEAHEADLIFDYTFRFTSDEDYSSHTIFNYYNIKVVSHRDTPPIKSFTQLKKAQSVVLNSSNDSISEKLLEDMITLDNVEFHTAREALAGLANGQYKYFIWGEEPLKWKLNELGLNDLVLNDIDIPGGEVHLVSHNRDLIDNIDDQYARLEQDGEVDRINTQWFHPEDVQKTMSKWPFVVTIATLLLTLLGILLYRFMIARVRVAIHKNEDIEAMMQQALSMGNYSVIVHNLKTDFIKDHSGKRLPFEGLQLDKLMARIHPADQGRVQEIFQTLKGGGTHLEPFQIRYHRDNMADGQYVNLQGNAFTEADDSGHVTNIVITTQDVTDELEQVQREQELGHRYLKMFDSTLVAMSFYNKEGHLIDMNDNMRKLCCPDERAEHYFRALSMFEMHALKGDFDPESRDHFHICQHMSHPEVGIDTYVEFRIRPIFDENDELQFYIVTAIDVSSERDTYLALQRHERALQQMREAIGTYEKDLHTLLENSNMYVWTFDLATLQIRFSRSLSSIEFSQSRSDYMSWMVKEEREAADRNLTETMMKGLDFHAVHHFYHTPVRKGECWFALNGIPSRNKHGQMTGYFGLARDVSDLMLTQQQLRQETLRAEDSGQKKATFLANMTHEIRTPLNAIVGFSDLLHDIDSPDDRQEFIRIIRNNCDMLLRLINDIIEASSMDSSPIAINPSEVDFAQVFSDICQSLAQRVQEPGVSFITENPYPHFLTTLDKGRMQQVITNFVTNAVKYTHEGHIKVGWRYEDSGIYMYCEDTGAGIPKEKQASVFERFVKLNDFVQGTGLGLSICKSIAERSGGRIGVESEGEGTGSTFWIWVPCPADTEQVKN